MHSNNCRPYFKRKLLKSMNYLTCLRTNQYPWQISDVLGQWSIRSQILEVIKGYSKLPFPTLVSKILQTRVMSRENNGKLGKQIESKSIFLFKIR